MEEMSCEDIPLAHHQRLIREAANVGEVFREILLKFADVHFAVNHARVVTHTELERIGMSK